MSATRAENRRAKRAATKAADHKASGFKDRATYQCAVIEVPRAGSLHNGAYTAEELHARAVARRDQRRFIEKMASDQQKASKEAAAARKLEAKAAARLTYLAACRKPQPVKYMHSAARRRLFVAPVALAA